MTKSEKRERALRENVRNVRYRDRDLVLRSYDFLDESSGSHVTYQHRMYADIRCTILRPHGGETQVKPAYVRLALDAIDRVKARTIEET